MLYKRLLLPLVGLTFAVSFLLESCNSDSDSYTYSVSQSSVAVSSFTLQANASVLSGLDSVFFSIDLERALIFNADSLPKGTSVDALIAVISFPSSVTKAEITMEGGTKREGTIDYLSKSTDSIDFTGRVYLDLTSSEGNSRLYQIKVNVHTMEPDSLWWGNTAVATLPSRFQNPKEQRTISTGQGSVASLIQEYDGSFTFSTTEDAFSGEWLKNPASFAFEPDVRSMVWCDSQYYLLDETGGLHTSSTGYDSWTQISGRQWQTILGIYMDNVVGVTADGASFESYPDDSALSGFVPSGFPVSGISDMQVIYSDWWQKPYAVMYGGQDAQGIPMSDVWAYDGSRWAQISNGGLPALTGAALVPYFAYKRSDSSWNFYEYSVLMVLGGKDSDGELNRSMYISYDNGVNWYEAGELMQMPEYIPGMYDLDAIIASTSMSGNIEPTGWSTTAASGLPSWYKINYTLDGYDITWECPYIYLYGGRNSDGSLYDTIWRGVIRRLTFVPLL